MINLQLAKTLQRVLSRLIKIVTRVSWRYTVRFGQSLSFILSKLKRAETSLLSIFVLSSRIKAYNRNINWKRGVVDNGQPTNKFNVQNKTEKKEMLDSNSMFLT